MTPWASCIVVASDCPISWLDHRFDDDIDCDTKQNPLQLLPSHHDNPAIHGVERNINNVLNPNIVPSTLLQCKTSLGATNKNTFTPQAMDDAWLFHAFNLVCCLPLQWCIQPCCAPTTHDGR